MRFERKLTVVLEAIMGAKDYKPPLDNPQQLLADFYSLSMLSEKTETIKHASQEHIDYEVQRAQKLLAIALKNHLLQKAGFSILGELSHMKGTMTLTPKGEQLVSSPATTAPNTTHVTNDTNRITQIFTAFGVNNTEAINLIFSPDYGSIETANRTRKRELSNNFPAMYPLVVAGAKIFQNDNYCHWSSAFGGDAWCACCLGWLSLYKANNLPSAIAAIDHLYDLQHNNGSLLDKNAEYGGSWLKKMLDLKFRANDVEQLLYYASPYVQKLGTAVIKANYSRTANKLTSDQRNKTYDAQIGKHNIKAVEDYEYGSEMLDLNGDGEPEPIGLWVDGIEFDQLSGPQLQTMASNIKKLAGMYFKSEPCPESFQPEYDMTHTGTHFNPKISQLRKDVRGWIIKHWKDFTSTNP